MQHIPPYPEIPGDNADRIMAKSGDVVGFSRSRVVWRFGFMTGSPLATAFSVNTGDKGFLFLLTTNSGKRLAEFWGFGCELPKRFRHIIEARPFDLPTDDDIDATEVEADDLTDDDIDSTPCEGDYTISPCGPLGSRLFVGVVGGTSKAFHGEFEDFESAMVAIRANMDAEKFWPNVWSVSDHGNYSLVTDELPDSVEEN